MGAFNKKYDQLAQAIEARVVRMLGDPALQARELKAIAGTLGATQKIRHQALGGDADRNREFLEGTVAGLYLRDFERDEEEERGATLGRCRAGAATEEAEPSTCSGQPGPSAGAPGG